MIHLTVNGREVEIEEGSTILEAARKINIDIPTLCFLKDINTVDTFGVIGFSFGVSRISFGVPIFPTARTVQCECRELALC